LLDGCTEINETNDDLSKGGYWTVTLAQRCTPFTSPFGHCCRELLLGLEKFYELGVYQHMTREKAKKSNVHVRRRIAI
jgi:hypothetical protein